MVSGVGIDLVEIKRIENSLRRFGNRFLKRLYTEDELAYCLNQVHPPIHLAARFAAKEAISKALGIGWRGFSWREIEITHDNRHAPKVSLYGRPGEIFKSKGEKILLSISHTKDIAIAQAILISRKWEVQDEGSYC